MKRYHYQVTVDLADQDEDLKDMIPILIRHRFEGTAAHVVFVGGPLVLPEGGAREPRGTGADSPAPGKPGVPGGSDDYLPVAPAGDDPADLRENIRPLSPEEFTAQMANASRAEEKLFLYRKPEA